MNKQAQISDAFGQFAFDATTMPLENISAVIKQPVQYLIDGSPPQLHADGGIAEYPLPYAFDLRHSDNLFPKIQQGSKMVFHRTSSDDLTSEQQTSPLRAESSRAGTLFVPEQALLLENTSVCLLRGQKRFSIC